MNDVFLAFGLTAGAGFATCLGSLATFCVNVDRPVVLALLLSFSAGVMVFVAFVSLFGESLSSFRLAEQVGERYALLAATSCFFAGICITVLLDLLVHRIHHRHHHNNEYRMLPSHDSEQQQSSTETTVTSLNSNSNVDDHDNDNDITTTTTTVAVDAVDAAAAAAAQLVVERRKSLRKLALFIAVAMVIHNLPEGMATYISTLNNKRLGIGLALAIALHNVPAGICIAVPFYSSSGSRWKAVALASFVGACEPIGALLAYAFLAAIVGPIAFGIVFGVVSGMLVHIALHESLSQARRYSDKFATIGFVFGMLVIAVSMVLFDVL